MALSGLMLVPPLRAAVAGLAVAEDPIGPIGLDAVPTVSTAVVLPIFNEDIGRVIRGVTNGPSPDWLQDRLRAIGLRPIPRHPCPHRRECIGKAVCFPAAVHLLAGRNRGETS